MASRRRRRWLVPVVVLVLLLAVGVGGELLARSAVEDRVRSALTEELPGTEGITTHLPDRPVLFDLVRQELSDVTVEVQRLRLDSVIGQEVSATDVDLHVRHARLDRPITLDGVNATGTVPMSDLSTLAAARLSEGDLLGDVRVDDADGELVAHGTLAGSVPVELGLRPEAAARELRLTPTAISVAGLSLDLDSPRLAKWEIDTSALTVPISLDALPAGAELTDVAVTPSGLQLALAATELVLPQGNG